MFAETQNSTEGLGGIDLAKDSSVFLSALIAEPVVTLLEPDGAVTVVTAIIAKLNPAGLIIVVSAAVSVVAFHFAFLFEGLDAKAAVIRFPVLLPVKEIILGAGFFASAGVFAPGNQAHFTRVAIGNLTFRFAFASTNE